MTRSYQFGNPANILEGEQRRKKGCYACALSDRKEIDGKMRSYCQAEMSGYPDNNVETCTMGVPKWRNKQ